MLTCHGVEDMKIRIRGIFVGSIQRSSRPYGEPKEDLANQRTARQDHPACVALNRRIWTPCPFRSWSNPSCRALGFSHASREQVDAGGVQTPGRFVRILVLFEETRHTFEVGRNFIRVQFQRREKPSLGASRCPSARGRPRGQHSRVGAASAREP